MSVQNLQMNLSAQQFDKPNSSTMLPYPTRYTHSSNSYSCTSTASSSPNSSKQLSLPPIRELLKSSSPTLIQQAQPQAQVTTRPSSQISATPIHAQQPLPQQQSQLYQPQDTTHQSPYSNPITPIAITPEQPLLRQQQPQQAPNLIPRSNSYQSYYSHQPQQRFQHHYSAPQYQPQQHQPISQQQYVQQPYQQVPHHQGGVSPVSLPISSCLEATRSSSSSPISSTEESKDKLNTRKKRQNLPRQTTLILLSWLSEHLDRPYPNSREKYELLLKTRLTIQQLDNWFINARRRKISILKKLKENDQNIALTF